MHLEEEGTGRQRLLFGKMIVLLSKLSSKILPRVNVFRMCRGNLYVTVPAMKLWTLRDVLALTLPDK